MTEAELKLTLFRWIDQLSGEPLQKLFEFVGGNMENKEGGNTPDNLEAGYAAMAVDEEREVEALEWVEGILMREV